MIISFSTYWLIETLCCWVDFILTLKHGFLRKFIQKVEKVKLVRNWKLKKTWYNKPARLGQSHTEESVSTAHTKVSDMYTLVEILHVYILCCIYLINFSDLFVGCIFQPALRVLRHCVFRPAFGWLIIHCYILSR